MTLIESVRKNLISEYASFYGKASRSEFWSFILFSVLLKIICIVANRTILKAEIGEFLFMLIQIILFLPETALSWRRLEDAGIHGRFSLIPSILMGSSIIFNIAAINGIEILNEKQEQTFDVTYFVVIFLYIQIWIMPSKQIKVKNQSKISSFKKKKKLGM